MTKDNSLLLLTKITIIALIIGAISLPSILETISPFWMLIFFIYWIIYTNTKALYLFALILGLLTDILQGSILGQNALALLISSAFIFNVKKSFYVSNLTTQQVYIFIASLILSLIHI